MNLLDQINKMVFGAGPFVLKTINGIDHNWDIVVLPSDMSVKPGPSGPMPITILKIGVQSFQGPQLILEARGGSWNTEFNKPHKKLPRIKDLLIAGYLVAAQPENEARQMFLAPHVLEQIYALRNIYISMGPDNESTSHLFFDGEIVFGTDIKISRIKKMVACFETWLPQFESEMRMAKKDDYPKSSPENL